jgi:hypothetical protein
MSPAGGGDVQGIRRSAAKKLIPGQVWLGAAAEDSTREALRKSLDVVEGVYVERRRGEVEDG